ncbi:AraC family transcriptional regulator [Fulvivirgaceae bacterium BMA10]|uniref:AraC family transcriptional regulator n=1 Tax=Splendidivirga corallicola TaxID=3051826 RepID=A0ABT8KVP4_9BACT|nr:AraC family transcriptional regulator [Fulvivirgaceae bacterium BMA10]
MENEIDDTRKDYWKRINNVIAFIEKNLDQELRLDDLSQKAFFSPFHFHRIFSAIVGEPLNTFVNRKRIERIASILAVGTSKPLVELAFKYGFNSPSSFSRAFRKFYGISPTDFKKRPIVHHSKIGKGTISYEQYICSINNILNWIGMNAQIKLIELPEIRLAGIMHIGKPDKIGDTYERLFKWAYSEGVADSPHFKAITIYHDNPKITEMSKVRQSACVTIEEGTSTAGDVVKVDIRKGKYAIGRFEISPSVFPKAWESMCVWVIENGHTFRDGDYFEIFHNDHRTHPEHKFIVDICIPIDSERNKKVQSVESLNDLDKACKKQKETDDTPKANMGLIGYMKSLRAYFIKNYPDDYVTGNIYFGDRTITYFPFTPKVLKKQKLKIAIVFNHQDEQFEIWLAGQNKQIQKEYWEIFKGSDWDKYHIPDTIENRFSIVDHILEENPDFNAPHKLTEHIERETLKFINEMEDVLG